VEDLPEGLYETLIDAALSERLARLSGRSGVDVDPLRSADAADRIALFLSREVERALDTVPERDRVDVGISVLASLIDRLSSQPRLPSADPRRPATPGRVLRAVGRPGPDGVPRRDRQPLIPLLDTALLTNAPGEPGVGSQIKAEIESADRIDVVMAFIRMSGIRPIADDLAAHCDRRRSLRILTTSYTGSTQAAALDLLQRIGAEVRVSYDVTSTRLHAKSWLFHRASGFSTAYIGSSNLTHSAQVTGLEWNVRVSQARNRTIIEKIAAVFDSYWEGGDFVPFDGREFRERTAAASDETPTLLSPLEVTLRPFQERLLEQIKVARLRGRHANLLASATGTGKTVMAAVDYGRLRGSLPRARLLFVAHREEILDQSMATFRHVLRDGAFGEKWVGGNRPAHFSHVFASIQSLNAAGIESMSPDHFDVVVIDEFHHAAAPSYAALLNRLCPRELLGLTATPERSDGLDVLSWFGGEIAAELRLWDAIDQQYLTPFAYYGIHDGVDLSGLTWKRGMGYDPTELSNLYTGHEARANLVIKQIVDKIGDVATLRAIGFCVSVDHASFMARHLSTHGIPAIAVTGETSAKDRSDALRALRDGKIRIVFTVDLYNEGVDVPDVDALLMLRPTESPTLFLQQLGRGLRRSPGKAICTVLDFIGNHRREFRFDRKYRALLGGSRRDLERSVQQDFPFLPAGAHMELDRVARDAVLRSIREAIPSTKAAVVREIRELDRSGGEVSIARLLDETGLELDDLYRNGACWSDLCESAGIDVAPAGPMEKELRRAIGRLLHVDDEVRLRALENLFATSGPPVVPTLGVERQRVLRMWATGLVAQYAPVGTSVQGAIDIVWQHPQVLVELRQLVPVLRERIDHAHPPADLEDVPLQVHARYTRGEILAALGEGDGVSPPPWREGVYHAQAARTDVLAFTLDKTNGAFSPTTRYRDYAISRELIHWESQSTTRADSPTGLRYRTHARMGHSILLFARVRQDDRAFYFLGPAQYVAHEGERPMAVTWRLETPLPGDLFEAFAAAVA
jgi:superfamily II DNA or RNA helicase/HKD family nuclease